MRKELILTALEKIANSTELVKLALAIRMLGASKTGKKLGQYGFNTAGQLLTKKAPKFKFK